MWPGNAVLRAPRRSSPAGRPQPPRQRRRPRRQLPRRRPACGDPAHPFFQVDLNDAQGMSHLVSVNNASARPALARMVLWTNWGVPTLAFDIYLTGYDVQTLNLRDLLLGQLPLTGSTVSSRGVLSEAGDFPGCAPPPAQLGRHREQGEGVGGPQPRRAGLSAGRPHRPAGRAGFGSGQPGASAAAAAGPASPPGM